MVNLFNNICFHENKKGQIAFDQIRCIDKIRLKKRLAFLTKIEISKVKTLIKEYLVD